MSRKFPSVPRSFLLRTELDFAEKGGTDDQKSDPHRNFISYGIDSVSDHGFTSPDDYANQLAHWQGTIIGPQDTNLGSNIYSIKINVPKEYPDRPPSITFETRINMAGVCQSSFRVDPNYFNGRSGLSWNNKCTIYDCLKTLRHNMTAASKLAQPRQS